MRRLLAQVMLLTEDISIVDRARYLFNAFIHFAPVALVLDALNFWFSENAQFGLFMCAALFINMCVGAVMHFKNGTFAIKDFLLKNVTMGSVVIVVYVMLEMLRYTAGDNFAGEAFKVIIQVMSLLYPTSKVLKNIHILSKGRYPPHFLMQRLYNFEKNGDLKKLFGE